MDKFLDKVLKSHELVENFKSAFLGSTRVRILDKDGNMVWSCADEYWRDKRFEGLEVEQDMDIYGVIKNLKNIVNG
jgi:hypothetical protein